MIYKKIQAVRKEIGVMTKDKKNPFFKSNYFDINQLIEKLEPLLEKNKLSLSQPLTTIGDKASLTTTLVDLEAEEETIELLIKGGHMVQWTVPLPDIQDPQKMGAAITYYRRYALQALFALQAEDNDGETAVGRGKKKDDITF